MFRIWSGVVVLVAVLCSSARAADAILQAPAPPSELSSSQAAQALLPARKVMADAQSGIRLRQSSQSAFQRGLLPLSDHLEHLAAMEEDGIRRATADASAAGNNRLALRQALQPRIDALQLAVRQMSAFRQPAAANWEADLLLGKYVLAQAEEEAAALTNDRSAVRAAKSDQQKWAQAHYARRVFDARILGHATPSAVAQAVTFLNVAPGWKRQVLHDTAAQTQVWQQVQAGIGRKDRVLDARLQVALWNVESRGVQTSPSELRYGLIEADKLTAELFDTQREYVRHGTATLADLSRTWQTRRQVHLLSNWVELPFSVDKLTALDRSLQDLSHVAMAVTDHRGRMAADVEYVRLLNQMHATDRLEVQPKSVETVHQPQAAGREFRSGRGDGTSP